jgi:hypothetical protein
MTFSRGGDENIAPVRCMSGAEGGDTRRPCNAQRLEGRPRWCPVSLTRDTSRHFFRVEVIFGKLTS